jgi:hypothetical protein
MPTTVACKLPHGLTITHNGQTINLNGANADVDPMSPMANGAVGDTATSVAGYGLTTLNDDQASAFEDYRLAALYKVKDGKPSKDAGMLEEPFAPFTNDTILTFKDETTARREVRTKANTPTGFDGIDGDAETRDAAAGSGLVEAGKQKG